MATIEHKEINKQKINRYILDNTAGQETPILGTVTSFYKLLVESRSIIYPPSSRYSQSTCLSPSLDEVWNCSYIISQRPGVYLFHLMIS